MAWEKLGHTKLCSTSDIISVSSLTNKKFYNVLTNGINSGTTSHGLRVNTCTGCNYARRSSFSGGCDSFSGACGDCQMLNYSGGYTFPAFMVEYVYNIADKEKLSIGHIGGRGTAGISGIPSRAESSGKWVNQSTSINEIRHHNIGTGSYAACSSVSVFGESTTTVNDEGLVAYYKYNESSGNLINLSQSGAKFISVDGTSINSPTYSQTGQIGQAISIHDDGFQIGATASDWDFFHDTTTDVTISWWMKMNATEESGASNKIIGNSNLIAGSRGLLLYLDDLGEDHELRAELVGASLEQDVITTGASYVPKDTTTWYHYIFELDKSTGRGDFWRDDANNFNQTPTHTFDDGTSATLPVKIGFSSNSINATLDEMSIWSRLLTTSERTELFNSGSGLEIY